MSTCPTPSKRKHPSKAAALRQFRSLRATQGRAGTLHTYLCRCGSYHVGHRPKGMP